MSVYRTLSRTSVLLFAIACVLLFAGVRPSGQAWIGLYTCFTSTGAFMSPDCYDSAAPWLDHGRGFGVGWAEAWVQGGVCIDNSIVDVSDGLQANGCTELLVLIDSHGSDSPYTLVSAWSEASFDNGGYGTSQGIHACGAPNVYVFPYNGPTFC